MFKSELFALRDEWYRGFQCKLMPTVDESRVIGIRTPQLRNYARQIRDTAEAKEFLTLLPHKYYEENNLHGFLIEFFRDYDECVTALDRFLPFVDNWATCDSINPKVLGKNPERLIADIRRWLKSEDIYTVRFGLKMLMTHFLEENFKADYLNLAAATDCTEYYLSMMTAWFFATALAKQYESTVPYITEQRLDRKTHEMTVRKAIESFRISDSQRQFLKNL